MSVSETTAEPPCNQNLQFLRPKKKKCFLVFSSVSSHTSNSTKKTVSLCPEDNLSGRTTSCSYYEGFTITLPQEVATVPVQGVL